jgi:ABC-2 type transport system ATP-binding protein
MVDLVNRARVREVIGRQSSRCVLLASHDLADIQAVCDRAYVMACGRFVAQGSPRELAERVGTPIRVELISYEKEAIQTILRRRPWRPSWDGPRCRLVCSSLTEGLDLASELASSGSNLESLRIEAPALEEAILELLRANE